MSLTTRLSKYWRYSEPSLKAFMRPVSASFSRALVTSPDSVMTISDDETPGVSETLVKVRCGGQYQHFGPRAST